MAGMAPVLMAERRFADMMAFGAPVSTSERVTIRMDLGSPRDALWLLEP